MHSVQNLSRAAFGIHAADQIALVCVPLVAALVFDVSPQTIGVLVACQSLAHLIGSLPFGILVDTVENRRLAILATLISFAGFLGAAISVWAHMLILFGISVVGAGCGIVLFVLTTLSVLPKTVPQHALAPSNAQIELPRAVASFAVPLILGVFVSIQTVDWVFPAGVLCAALAFCFVRQLPIVPVSAPQNRVSPLRQIIEGAEHVRSSPVLRAIAWCAIFWNLAFSALLVTMVPFLSQTLSEAPGNFGIALGCFGAGSILGSWISKKGSGLLTPRFVLLFGPGSSAAAACALFALPQAGTLLALYVVFFVLGFGPSMWLIAQNSVRQIVTPAHVLGRVNAVIQTAIYGMRPLGAVAAGALVTHFGPLSGVIMVAVLFALSLCVAAFSELRNIRRYSDLREMFEVHTA